MDSSNNNGLPQDVLPEWLDIFRHAQAACSNNNGLAILTLKIAVNKNKPIIWVEADVRKVHPMRVAKMKMTPAVAAVLSAMVD